MAVRTPAAAMVPLMVRCPPCITTLSRKPRLTQSLSTGGALYRSCHSEDVATATDEESAVAGKNRRSRFLPSLGMTGGGLSSLWGGTNALVAPSMTVPLGCLRPRRDRLRTPDYLW